MLLFQCATSLLTRANVGHPLSEVDYRARNRRSLIVKRCEGTLVDGNTVETPASQACLLYDPSRVYRHARSNEALQIIHWVADWHPQAMSTQLVRQECRYLPVLLHYRNTGIGSGSTNCLNIGKLHKGVKSLWRRMLETPPQRRLGSAQVTWPDNRHPHSEPFPRTAGV
jgi:hypothetical protein